MPIDLPDETGWYWAYRVDANEWLMVFVDCGVRERIFVYGGEDGTGPHRFDYDDEQLTIELGRLQWYGKINCPGGDFGNETVIISQEMRALANQERKAIVLTHVDYRHCDDERHGANITSVSVMSREEATQHLHREITP